MHGGEARHSACMRLALFQPGPGLLGTAALNKNMEGMRRHAGEYTAL